MKVCANPECGREFHLRNPVAKFCSTKCKNRYSGLKRRGAFDRPKPPSNFREAFIAAHLETDRIYRIRTPRYGRT